MKNRSTNYELLRIILTVFIPIYHWLLYNGIFYADNSSNNLISIVFFSGIPFSCLYAFIAMSSYFLLKKQYKWNAQKFFMFLAQIITLLIFKNIFIRTLFHDNMYDFIGDFFINGAWWYIYPYLLLMLFYPLLNYIIFNIPIIGLYITTTVVGIVFFVNTLINNTVFKNDCVTFLLVYLIMGCFERHTDVSAFYSKHKTKILIGIYITCALALTLFSIYLKHPANNIPLKIENPIFQKLHGRYNIFGLCSGIALFTMFKDIEIPYTPIIHRISKITFYIFLLHETVMSVFWYFEIKGTENLAYLPAVKFFLLIFIYLICCIVTAYVVYKIYSRFIEPLWLKAMSKLCELSFTQKIETFYSNLSKK